jgi:PAS domain-containing protein
MHSETPSRKEAFRGRRAVFLLISVAAMLEVLSWPIDTHSTPGIAIKGALTLLALSFGFGAVLVVVLRLSTGRLLKLAICLAGVLILSAEFLNTTGKPEAWADIPLLGVHSAFRDLVVDSLQVGGYVLFLGGLSLALWEVHISNKALETKNADLARQVAGRVRALRELDDRAKRLSAAEETARMGSWEWDAHAGKVMCSDGLASLFGLQAHERELSYEGLLAHIHLEDRESMHRTIQEAWDARGTLDVYHRAVDSRGEVRVLHSRGTVVVDESGVPVRMIGTRGRSPEAERGQLSGVGGDHHGGHLHPPGRLLSLCE